MTDIPPTSRQRAVATVVVGLALTGVPIGALWAWMAPAAHGVAALTHDGERVHDELGPEAEHFFVAAVLMLGLASVVAAVAAVLVWQWRSHRGPAIVAGLCVGILGAAAVAAGVGALLVHWQYGTVNVDAAPVTQQNPVYYFTKAPPVFFGHTPPQIACTLVAPAAVGGLVYAVLAAANPRDDLGGYPGVEGASAPAVVVGASSARS